MRNSLLIAIFAALATASVAAAQGSPPPFLFVTESTVEDAKTSVWGLAMQDVAAAHARHPRGSTWAAYRAMTGGPESRFRFHAAVQKLAELDDWPSNRRVVIETLGRNAGKAALSVLDSTTDPTDRLMAYNAELSRPPTPRPAPYRNLWIMTVEVQQGKLIEYASLMQRIKKAHEAHERGLHWVAYGNAIGGGSGQVELLFAFDDFAELDSWPGTLEVLGSHYGEDEAARILEALDSVADTVSEIWSLAPRISVIPEGGGR
jgi:hypothetical protein